MAGGWWLVAGGWWLVAGGWWLTPNGTRPGGLRSPLARLTLVAFVSLLNEPSAGQYPSQDNTRANFNSNSTSEDGEKNYSTMAYQRQKLLQNSAQ